MADAEYIRHRLPSPLATRSPQRYRADVLRGPGVALHLTGETTMRNRIQRFLEAPPECDCMRIARLRRRLARQRDKIEAVVPRDQLTLEVPCEATLRDDPDHGLIAWTGHLFDIEHVPPTGDPCAFAAAELRRVAASMLDAADRLDGASGKAVRS